MRSATLIRDVENDEGTFGLLAAGPLRLHVAELPDRGNAPNLSRIPAGRYDALPHASPRFGRCLAVPGVEGRTHILIHGGNVAGDVERGWRSHSRGCLLPGLRRGRLTLGGRQQAAVLSSRTALRHLLSWADDRPFRLEIVR